MFNTFMLIAIVVSSTWMAIDAEALGYRKQDIRGLAAISPLGWFVCGILLWIVTVPVYLIKRPELRAAGKIRREALASRCQ